MSEAVRGAGRPVVAVLVLALGAALGLSLRRAPAGGGARGAHRAEVVAAPHLPAAALDAAEGRVRAALAERAFPGAAFAAGVGPSIERVTAMGKIGWGSAAAPVSPDGTLYDLASLTKPVATATAVLLLAEDGRIDLDEPVQRWLPEFEGRFKDRVTWRHLLTHTSGLPGGAVIRGDEPEERLRRLLRTRIDTPPGRLVEYTDLGYLVLWAAAGRAAGEPLERFLERRIWRPLGMEHTRFSPGPACEACAPTLRLRDGTPFQGRPHDLYARRLGGVAGNAGLFSTAADMARFSGMLAAGGELYGVRILGRETVAGMFRQQPGAGRRTLGLQAFCPDEAPDEAVPCADPVAFGHNGYTGTSLWIDPGTGTWKVLLTNRTYDVRNRQASREIGRVRMAAWEALRRAPGAAGAGE